MAAVLQSRFVCKKKVLRQAGEQNLRAFDKAIEREDCIFLPLQRSTVTESLVPLVTVNKDTLAIFRRYCTAEQRHTPSEDPTAPDDDALDEQDENNVTVSKSSRRRHFPFKNAAPKPE